MFAAGLLLILPRWCRMKRSRLSSLVLATLATALPVVAAQAQATQPQPVQTSSDSLAVEADSVPQHNWVVNVLRKVTFRGDDAAAADSAAAASAASSANAASARRIPRTFDSKRDRAEYMSARAKADRASGYRIVVDIEDHRLYVIDGQDTLRSAPVATASNETLRYGGKAWHFETPRGVRTVLRKDEDPTWTPPEWHYAEVANEYGLKLRQLSRGERVRVRDGTILTTQGDEVGVILPGTTEFVPLVLDEHVVFDNTLFIPPAGTKHRSMKGELGHYRLALGDGYQIHGTPYQNSIGSSVTHGCVRMHDEDIEWMYNNVPVGTKVYLY
jgi:lipoprotein-anchoring transpeptidase ErfK/SrfK